MTDLILWTTLLAAIPFVSGLVVETRRARPGSTTTPRRHVRSHRPHTPRARAATSRRVDRTPARVVGRAQAQG